MIAPTTTRIPLADPRFDGNEAEYVQDCLASGWISGSGPYLERFERDFATFCGARHAVAVSNGTAALHLALLAVGVGPGDEVIVPDLTYVATANAVRYCGATPVFADVDPRMWCIQPQKVRELTSYRTKAILPVHLYGYPANLALLSINRPLYDGRPPSLIDDAAEAHGTESEGQRIGGGALADATTWSFHAGKIITTGEGGMVTTDDERIAETIRLLRAHGMDPERRYWFPVVGYNYRLTNLQAAVGVAQLERIDALLLRRRTIVRLYDEMLVGQGLQLPAHPENGHNVHWLYSVVLPLAVNRDAVLAFLAERGIEARPFFHPLHHLPPYVGSGTDRDFPVATWLGAQGLSLPSSASLAESDVERVARALLDALRACQE